MDFGSASPQVGGTDALNQAVARRQTGEAGATSQVTPAAPTYDPATQTPPMPMSSGGGMPTASAATAGAPAPATPAMPVDPAELKMIVGSLSNRLKAISKLQGA